MRAVLSFALAALLAGAAHAQTAPGDWPLYARDNSGQRITPLDQINAANVGQLERAWQSAIVWALPRTYSPEESE